MTLIGSLIVHCSDAMSNFAPLLFWAIFRYMDEIDESNTAMSFHGFPLCSF